MIFYEEEEKRANSLWTVELVVVFDEKE